MDYVCGQVFDLVVVTYTWLYSIRAQLCSCGYWFLVNPRDGYRGGGTTLPSKDSLKVTSVNFGRLESSERSEWIVSLSASNNLRVIIVY